MVDLAGGAAGRAQALVPGAEAGRTDPGAPIPAPAPLSAIAVWRGLRDYYSASGADAWTDTVPYHVTSNPLIADSYANVMVRFIGDVLATGRFDPAEPFYVVELGAGSGKFGFHLLRRLTDLRRQLGLGEVNVVHVMTDVARANIEHWRRHPRLRPFVDAGMLTFGYLDVEVDGELRLAGDEGRPGNDVARFSNPPILVANYLFDSISQDFFQHSHGRLDEMLAALVPMADTGPAGRQVADGRRKLEWTAQAVAMPRYHDEDIDAALVERLAGPADESVLFPIGTLRFLKRFLAAAGGRLCLMASDLGVAEPGLARHLELELSNGYFYLPVDLDIVGHFLQRLGPGIHASVHSAALDTAVTVVGFHPDELRETGHAFSTFVDTFGPVGQKTVALLTAGGPTLSVEQWLSIASLLRYDSCFLDASVDLARTWARSGPLSPRLRDQMLRALERIGSNCYWLPGAQDTYFNMGLILHELNEIEAAMAAFTASLTMVGDAPETHFNLGLCLYGLRRPTEARASFERAVTLNPRHIMARGWTAQIDFEAGGPTVA